MKTSDFSYDLPESSIAQHPVEPRDTAKLMLLSRGKPGIQHKQFRDILELLTPGDALILNDTRVLPARLFGLREKTGARVEFLLLKSQGDLLWDVLVKPGRKAQPGDTISFGSGRLQALILEQNPDGGRLVRFSCSEDFYTLIERLGEMPLPHYITAPLKDRERYQTVYARERGSVAAPTAGLHFTPELLAALRAKKINIGQVTLHVGLGTFRPVKTPNLEDHQMHSESFSIPEETAQLIRDTKTTGGRVVSVGTTTCRTLESVMQQYGAIRACTGSTNCFIYPGYEFRCIDGLLTNFHLPESTLLMLVSAFHGQALTLNAYATAVRESYRFYSFGDCMLII